MPELLDRLKAALADRYAIQEELGAGGMATVYLARDPKHVKSDLAHRFPVDRKSYREAKNDFIRATLELMMASE